MPLRVVSLTRYPVKSLLGESLAGIEAGERGCAGDRLWPVRTAENRIGSGKSTRRFAAVAGLLELRAAAAGGTVMVSFPDGTTLPAGHRDAPARLSAALGRPLTFARETDVSHFDDGPVSLVGTASIGAIAEARGEPVAAARFRANILPESSEPYVEQSWIGRLVRLGTATLRVTLLSVRCVMIDMKTADLPAQPGNLKAAGRVNDTALGVIAKVVTPGTVELGDVAVPL